LHRWLSPPKHLLYKLYQRNKRERNSTQVQPKSLSLSLSSSYSSICLFPLSLFHLQQCTRWNTKQPITVLSSLKTQISTTAFCWVPCYHSFCGSHFQGFSKHGFVTTLVVFFFTSFLVLYGPSTFTVGNAMFIFLKVKPFLSSSLFFSFCFYIDLLS